MRLIDADALLERLIKKTAGPANKRFTEGFNDALMRFRSMVSDAPTIEAYTIEDLRDAFRDGQDNECSYHWGIIKAEPWYMKDEVRE